MALGQKRHVERTTAACRVVETHLITQNGLSRTWFALQDLDIACQKPTVQHDVEPGDPSRHPICRRSIYGHAWLP